MKRLRGTALIGILALGMVVTTPLNSFAQELNSGAVPKTARTLPSDVHPTSLNRLPLAKREEMKDEAARKLYDQYLNSSPNSLVGLQGPNGTRLHSPRLAVVTEPLNAYLRFDTGIPRRFVELAILITAREMNSQFEWTLHEPMGVKEGLEQSIIDVVKFRKDTRTLAEKEAIIIAVGRELFGTNNLSPTTFEAARKAFGDRGIVDLISIMTNYVSTAYFIKAFDMQLHSDKAPLLPLP